MHPASTPAVEVDRASTYGTSNNEHTSTTRRRWTNFGVRLTWRHPFSRSRARTYVVQRRHLKRVLMRSTFMFGLPAYVRSLRRCGPRQSSRALRSQHHGPRPEWAHFEASRATVTPTALLAVSGGARTGLHGSNASRKHALGAQRSFRYQKSTCGRPVSIP